MRIVCTILILLGLAWPAHGQIVQIRSPEYPPYFYVEDGVVKGSSVRVLREAFRRMGRPIQVDVVPFARALLDVVNGHADAIATLYRSPEREQYLDFSQQAVVIHTVALFVPVESKLHFNGDLASLSAYRFGAVRKSSYGSQFDQGVASGLLKNLEYTRSSESAVKMLMKARFDILVNNRIVVLTILKRESALGLVRELSPPLETVPSFIAFSRKRPLTGLRKQFDQVLAAMKADGSYASLSEPAL